MIKFINQFSVALAADLALGETTISLTDASKLVFDQVGDYYILTLIKSGTNDPEIVKATAKAGNDITVIRAQEGTAPLAFLAGASVENRVTAESCEKMTNYYTGLENLIFNGSFNVNAAVVSGEVVLAAGQYGHDMFKGGVGGCTYTFAAAGGITTVDISAGSLIQIIEGELLQGVKYILTWEGAAQARVGGGAYSASGIIVDVAGGVNLEIEFNVGGVTKIHFEQGTEATTFKMRPPEIERSLCELHYERWSYADFSSNAALAHGHYRGGDTFFMFFQYAKKRIKPTINLISAANFGVQSPIFGNGDYVFTLAAGGLSVVNVGKRSAKGIIQINLTAAPLYYGAFLVALTDGYIEFDARL